MPIGRDAELALVAHRLSERRLVTLTGPGGIGKTTLGQAAVALCSSAYAEGVRLVDLTRVQTADALQESLAGQLGYTSFRALLDAPGDHPVLVLVDNCEHVIDAAADAIERLLAACEMPTVLATSRTPLEVPGEAVIPLGPLALPEVAAVDAPAVQLFLERAGDAGVQLVATETIAELCRRLDGVPLAIELAAARTPSMTPEEILDRLTDGIDVLDRPRRRSAPRHRSLRAAIDWSLDLLEPDEAAMMAAVSVFGGPFTASLANRVIGAARDTDDQIQDRLDALVAASLLVADTRQPPTRYRILETVRHHALGRLDPQARHDLEVRHVDDLIVRVLDIIERASSTWQADALAELLDRYDDISAATRWCLAHDETPDRAFVFGAVLWGVIHQAHAEDVADLVEQILDRWPDSTHPMRADVAATAATCRYMAGDLRGAIDLAEAVLAEAEQSSFAPATLRRALAQAHRADGDVPGARRWFAEAADEARRLGLHPMAFESDSARAQLLADVGELDEALALVRRTREAAAELGSEISEVWASVIEGSILVRTDPGAADRVLELALAAAQRIGYDAGISVAQRSLALVALCRDDAPQAARHATALLEGLLARGSTSELRMVLDVAVPILRASGHVAAAADLAATARSLPVVSVTASVGHELFPLGDGDGATPLPVRDAILLVRAELAAVSAGARDERHEQAERAERAERADPGSGRFRRVGDVYELHFRGETVTLRANKGLADIARLLREPGRELHAVELAGAGVEQHGTGDLLDTAARRAYEDRIRELQAEIDDADDANDIGRSERASEEMDTLIDQLTAALGLGGRARDTGGTAERARSAVTQRIRTAIRKIEDAHPPLGRHLRSSIRTGTFCLYVPEVDTRWET